MCGERMKYMRYCTSSFCLIISWDLKSIWCSLQLNCESLQKRGSELFHTYGPCARTIINLCLESSREEDHGKSIERAANHVAKNGSTVMASIKDLDFGVDDTPSSLIFIRPESKEKRNIATVYIPTRFLINALTSAAADLNNLELHKLFL
jgi:hypothetical protein